MQTLGLSFSLTISEETGSLSQGKLEIDRLAVEFWQPVAIASLTMQPTIGSILELLWVPMDALPVAVALLWVMMDVLQLVVAA